MGISGLLHGELKTLACGIVYWCCIPSCFIFLQIYSIANLNDCSWGTRQSGAKKDNRTPLDIAWQHFKDWCHSCCNCPVARIKEEAEESSEKKQIKSAIYQKNNLK